MYDIVIIGAGVIGCGIARELSRYKLNILLLEKENDVAQGATKANSAIVHAGYDAPFSSRKGKFNAYGNKLYDEVCRELDVPFRRTGSLVCAFQDEDVQTLHALMENGKKLKIPGLAIIERDKIKEIEPNINEEVVAALYAPSAGITEPWELAIAYAENAMENGVELKLNFKVLDIKKIHSEFRIYSEHETIKTRYVINCAGVFSDTIYNMVATEEAFSITPKRGQYYLLDKVTDGLVNSVLFHCPSKKGKGVLVAPTVDRNILVGPDAEILDQNSRELVETTRDGLHFVKKSAQKLVPAIPFNQTITTFSGIRAEPSTGDFIIGESQIRGFINVAGIKSPGLSSAPAIALYIVDLLKAIDLTIVEKDGYNPVRRKRIKFESLSDEEKNEMIAKDPAYGRIICRCEMITEGEIVDAIRRKAGATTLNGIKRRVRPGAGRCQGGFCAPRVMEILARELGRDMLKIEQEKKGSYVLAAHTKEMFQKEGEL